MTNSKIERQLELEDECAGLGVKRYRQQVQDAKDRGREGDLYALVGLMDRVLEPASKAISGWIEDTRSAKYGAGKKASLVNFLEAFDVDQVAYIVAKELFNGASSKSRLQKVALSIVNVLEDELSYVNLKDNAPGLYRKIIRQTARSTSYRHRRSVMMVAANRAGFDWQKELSPAVRVKVGVLLIDLFCKATGLLSIETANAPGFGKTKSTKIVAPTQELLDWLERQHARLEVLSPISLPMVCRPDDWTTPYNGGYLNKASRRGTLIKTYNKAYLEELASMDLTPVYNALNGLQRTAWAINKPVLDVMREVWDMGGNLGNLPFRDLMPLPNKPQDIDTNKEALRDWKRAAAKVHEFNATSRSKRIGMQQKLTMAERFLDEEEFFYVWQLDWRGRAYPVTSTGVHPQADDSGKALLRFAKGRPLGDNGAYWLAVHIANLFGIDKVPFDDRVDWVLENEAKLLECAASPLDGSRFWTTADKPWCALAACFEWAGYVASGRGNDFVSFLPVALDGSCNGLQNFSAMLRDEVGGKAVNLTPSDQPQDIYAEVARVVSLKVDAAAEAGDELARAWQGKITRSVVKQPVMTLPYGATRTGMRDQIANVLRKAREEGEPIIEEEDNFNHCLYLARVVYDSIGEVVIAARSAMDWLKEAARVAAADGLPIYWTTPLGLPVMQRYLKRSTKRVTYELGASSYNLKLVIEAPEVDKRLMAQGISPNFVHSLDASHMMLTVNAGREEGIDSFAMVHDSYGTHAGDVEDMFRILRETFVSVYEQDVLGAFRDSLKAQLPPSLADELPELPATGTLELDQVKASQYFFA